MSAETINNHVLIPNRPNWMFKPRWSRTWQTAVTSAVVGKESRYALRANARVTLRYLITTKGIVATQELHDRLRAAVKSGLGCTPYYGRGAALVDAVAAGASEVTVTEGWDWQAGDYFFSGTEDGFDAKLVTAAVLDAGVWTLTLDEPLDVDHAEQAPVWPLLFGKLTAPSLPALTPRVGDVQVTISELTSARAAQLGEVVPDVGVGIGHMIVGTDNEVA
jgi:hypothetical protein